MTASRLRRAAILGLALLIVSAATSPVAADTASDVDDIRRQTAQVRGLQPHSDIPLEFIERDTFRRQLTRSYESPGSAYAFVVNQKLLAALGLLAADYDYRGSIRQLYGDEVGGRYDPDERKMYLIAGDGALGPRSKIIISHEFTHALQDQHFNLDRLLYVDGASSDRTIAVRALIEGDARLTQSLWGREFLKPEEKAALGQGASSPNESPLDRAPLVIRDSFLFPYLEGSDFAVALYQRGGHDLINQAFLDPPVSSEHIIHPDKYFAREAPASVVMPALADSLGGTWRPLRAGVMGELDLRILIGQFAPADADSAAAGWGGDRYAMLEDDDGRLVVVLNTAWDTESEAAEFYNAYAPTVAARFGPRQSRTIDEPSRIRWSTPNGPIQLLKTDDRVLVLYAPDADTLDSTAAQFR